MDRSPPLKTFLMSLIFLIVYPCLVSLVLVPLRRRRAAAWWSCAAIYALLSFALVFGASKVTPEAAEKGWALYQALSYSICTAIPRFAVLRMEIFARHPYLIPPIAVLLTWLGDIVAINLLLSAGYGF